MNIHGKSILITGASGGIGSAILRELSVNDITIFAHSHQNLDRTIVSGSKATIIPLIADFSQPGEIENMFREISLKKEKIDVVINAVGIETQMSDPLDTSQWNKTFQVNLFGIIECCRLAKKFMSRGGVIINISSIMGKHDIATPIDLTCYAVAKAALNKFTLNFAYAHANQLRAVTISPGYTLTQMWDSFDEKLRNECIEDTPIKRFIKPDEIAQAVRTVIENDAVTAQDIIIDGGLGTRLIS